MSLGPTHLSTLAEAREVAEACWRICRAGLDPRAERDRMRRDIELKPALDGYHEVLRAGAEFWRRMRPGSGAA
jgi:hypothetical protein